MLQPSAEQADLAKKLADLTVPVSELEEGLLVSATYDGEKRLAVLKFYDPKLDVIRLWEDNTSHRPYCVEGDTLLLGDNKTIAEVGVGDRVLGLSGQVAVDARTNRLYQGEMVKIGASGILPFRVTPEHPILVTRSKNSNHARIEEFEEPTWKLPPDLKPKYSRADGDYLVLPIAKSQPLVTELPLSPYSKMRSQRLKVRNFPLNEDTAWFLGAYVAEGSSGGRRGAVFSLNKNEKASQDRICKIGRKMGFGAYVARNGPNSVNVHVGGIVLARAMQDWCGHLAGGKRIPDFILFHPSRKILRSFLNGYTQGDGSVGITKGRKQKSVTESQLISSTSKLLVLQLQQAYARLGVFAGIKIQHKAGRCVIEGRRVHQNEAYTLGFVKRPKYTRARRVGNCFYVPIRSVEKENRNTTVYNIQTADGTYLVSNVVVHNCYTKLPTERLGEVRALKDVVDIQEEQKLDLLSDSRLMVRKIIANNPLAIGGSPGKSVRDMVEAWEADIKYYENYVYDRGLEVGTYYAVRGGSLAPVRKTVPETVARSLAEILSKNSGESTSFIRRWAELLGQPLCSFRRIATDIEVANEEGRIPDPEKAEREVIAVSFFNEAESIVYLFQRNGGDHSLDGAETKYSPQVFADEASMIRAAFSKMMDYPVLLTFNGDDFDLRYLKHRAERLGIREEEIPIALQRQEASLKHGVHIDLYRFFNNRSIQVYVYSKRYSEHTLNAISEALIDKSKLEFEGNIGDLPLLELSRYCLNDSQLTYELTSANSSLLMKILLVISRIAKMPMNDVARLGVSNWIRSMLFYEHRRINAIIPRQDELALKGGASSEAAIKGKKYKGGLVIEPTPGIHFGVSVLDFASLYPSLIKVYNLSYETVNCPHEECRSNKIPDTEHWVCRKRSGITSLVIGSLRDLRVSHYKHLAKDKTLSREERELSNTVSQGLKVILNACFTGDTDIVTLKGIRNIKDIKVGERVINVNPETLKVEVDSVVEVQRFPYRGEMYHFEDRRFVDLKVTPNHRFLVKDNRVGSKSGMCFRTAEEIFERTNVTIPKLKGGFESSESSARISLLTTAQRLGAAASLYPRQDQRLSSWFASLPEGLRRKIRAYGRANKNRSKMVGSLHSHYRLPAVLLTESDIDTVEDAGGRVFLGLHHSSKVPARYDSLKFASLCGWFVSEGSLKANEPKLYENGSYRGRSSGFVITQSYGKGNAMGIPYRAEIRDLIEDLGLRCVSDSRDKKYYQVSNGILHEWVRENCYVQGLKPHSSSKRVPDFVFSSTNLMKSFFASCYKGDGSSRDKVYSTKSLPLAREMVVLLSYLGNKCKIKYDQNDKIYRVVFQNVSSKLTSSGPLARRYVKKFEFDGDVYCVTTARNHTVIAGRNGRYVHVGQSYGVMGFETFALYCLPVAEATAALGRYAITKTIEKCGQEGVSVIYSDTDSLFTENPDMEKVNRVIGWAEKELNVELEVDKQYRYVAFSERKKNYFGVLQDGTADIKGLTGKKSQTPEFLKRTFYESLDILGKVYAPQDFEHARREIKALLTGTVSKLRNKEIPLEQLAFNVMIGKSLSAFTDNTPQHVRAAKLLQERGREIKAGDIISFVKTKTPPNVKPVSLAKVEEIDVDKYLEYASSMFDQMLDALGFSFDEILGSTTLDAFWS